MYFNYYGLKDKPFSLSADPKYVYYSRNHKEAFSKMYYAASQDAGFMILTGEVGTGKTIMINALIERLPKEYRVAKIYHTALNPEGLVQNICKEFGLDFLNKPLSQLVLKIQDFLKWTHTAGERSLLILDEAQNLNPETLEEIRLLSNFEAAHKKILQIFLVGQPELEDKLWSKNLRQLRDRISIRFQLTKLSREETHHYIEHRLRIAGNNGRVIFTPPAIDQIYLFSDGIPRRINILCENSLLMGYAENYKNVDDETVKKVGQYTQHNEDIPEFVDNEFDIPLFKIPKAKLNGSSRITNRAKVANTHTKSGKRISNQTKTVPIPNKHIKREQTPRTNNNVALEYRQFHNYMRHYLSSNQIYFSKKSKPWRRMFGFIFGIIFGFLLLVLAFLIAIKLALEPDFIFRLVEGIGF